jgi:hypothetical protein
MPGAGVSTSLPPADLSAPTVRVLSPHRGAKLRHRARIRATASDAVGVVRTEVTIDGDPFASADGARIKRGWSLRGVAAGRHRIAVHAWDAAGNVGSRSVRVRVLARAKRARHSRVRRHRAHHRRATPATP